MRLTIVAGLILGASLAVQSMLSVHTKAKVGTAATAVRVHVHEVAPWYIAMNDVAAWRDASRPPRLFRFPRGKGLGVRFLASLKMRDHISKGPLRDFKTGTGFAGAKLSGGDRWLALLASLRMTAKNQTVLIAPVEASSAGRTKSNASHPRSGSTRLTCTIIGI